MKKILFLVKQFPYEHEEIFTAAAKKNSIQLTIASYEDVTISFLNNRSQISIHEYDLSQFDLVFFRSVGMYTEIETLISEYCFSNSIPVIDSVFEHSKPWIDRKSFEYMRLSKFHIPIIETQFVSKKELKNISEKLHFPIIVKTTDGSQGSGVFLCNSLEEIRNIFDSTQKNFLLLQKYIQNDGDIRVFVIGTNVIGAIKRSSSSTEEFKNNISLGGTAKLYQLSDNERELALNAASALQYEIAGVDLILEENERVKVMEVNRSPQFAGFMKTTGINIPEKMIEYLLSKCR